MLITFVSLSVAKKCCVKFLKSKFAAEKKTILSVSYWGLKKLALAGYYSFL